ELYPVMLTRLREQRRVVRRIRDRRAGIEAPGDAEWLVEHRQDELLRGGIRQCAGGVLRRNAGRAKQSGQETGFVERVARLAPQRSSRAAKGTTVGLECDLVADELEDLRGVVSQGKRLLDDVRIGNVDLGCRREKRIGRSDRAPCLPRRSDAAYRRPGLRRRRGARGVATERRSARSSRGCAFGP